jgi:hypothetical protein
MANLPKGIPFRRHYSHGKRIIWPMVEKWLREEILPEEGIAWEDWERYIQKREANPEKIYRFSSYNTNPEGFGPNQIQKLKSKLRNHACHANPDFPNNIPEVRVNVPLHILFQEEVEKRAARRLMDIKKE